MSFRVFYVQASMYLLYSIALSTAVLLMSPLFLLRRRKYAAGLRERLGNYPKFKHDGRDVIWLHAVSVGEVNAARPLIEKLLNEFPDHRLVISTTTGTGQELAKQVLANRVDAVFYFPLDWKFSVRKALETFKPSLVLLMETEIWPRFIREANAFGAKVAIVNGRLSEVSFKRYAYISSFVRRVLRGIDLALMQNETDAGRLMPLGIGRDKVEVTGNMKFDQDPGEGSEPKNYFRDRFAISPERPLIIAASTHSPEEKWVLDAIADVGERSGTDRPRLVIAPRHPERFDDVAKLIERSGSRFARRSRPASAQDASADVILLDTIGELRGVFPLAEIIFVGGSLIPHGGQSILEPAAAGKAIITGPYTSNFRAAVTAFRNADALIELGGDVTGKEAAALSAAFTELLADENKRHRLGANALAVLQKNRGATERTVEALRPLLQAGKKTGGGE